MYLRAHAISVAGPGADLPAPIRRLVKRLNPPIGVGIAAAQVAAAGVPDRARLLLATVAPAGNGSAALDRAAVAAEALARRGAASSAAFNPSVALHAMDNLLLSMLSLAWGTRAPGINLGAAPGQVWAALEWALGQGERATDGLLLATGDRSNRQTQTDLLGCAVLLHPAPIGDHPLRIVAIERHADPGLPIPVAHSAAALARWMAAATTAPTGRSSYSVPEADGDGLSTIRIEMERQ